MACVLEPVTLPSEASSLSTLRRHVRRVARGAGVDEARVYRLCQAVDEIAANVIAHGYRERRGEPGAQLTLRGELSREALTIILEDTAPSFDPRLTPSPRDLWRPLDERSPGGLGVYLAMRGVDGFRYERMGGGNRSVFILRLEGGGGAGHAGGGSGAGGRGGSGPG